MKQPRKAERFKSAGTNVSVEYRGARESRKRDISIYTRTPPYSEGAYKNFPWVKKSTSCKVTYSKIVAYGSFTLPMLLSTNGYYILNQSRFFKIAVY